MAGLAVADAFTVESFLDGTHHSYVVSMSSGKPTILHMGDIATQEPNGLKLSVRVDAQKTQVYQTTAERIYKYFTYKPTVNIDINMELVSVGPSTSNWSIAEAKGGARYGYSNNYVVMAQVAYAIPDNQAIDTHKLRNMVFTINTGDVTFNPGRETLSLDTQTITKLNSMFKAAAAEIVSITQQAIALCSNDKEMYECYEKATQALPHALVQKIQLLCLGSPQLQSLIGSGSNFPVVPSEAFTMNTKNTLKIVYKQKHYKNFKDVQRVHATIQALFTVDHVIVDVKTKYTKGLQELYENDSVFVWKSTSNKVIENAVENAKTYLTAMGLPYKLASDIIPDESIKTSGNIPREGIYASRITSTRVPRSCKLDSSTLTTDTCLYLKLSNTTPVINSSSLTFDDYWALYKILARIGDMPVVWGVAKKYQAYTDKLENWVDFETYIEEKVKKTVFFTDSDHPSWANPHLISTSSLEGYPKAIQRHYENVVGYAAHIKKSNYVQANIQVLLKEMGVTLLPYEPPNPSEAATMDNDYPLSSALLFDSYRSYDMNSSRAQYIAKLEEFHAVHSNKEE